MPFEMPDAHLGNPYADIDKFRKIADAKTLSENDMLISKNECSIAVDGP